MADADSTQFGNPSAAMSLDSPFAPFRWPVFRRVWTANLTSALGSMIQMTAAAWLMTELTESHLLVALVQASVTVPVLLFGIFAGVIADNYDRRKVMLIANIAMLVLSAILAVLAWIGAIGPYSLLFFTMAIGAGFALNGPSWQASVRQMVPREDLPQAISLNTIAYNAARSVGPAIGGVVLSIWGPSTAFTINALSYLALVYILLRWRPVTPPRAQRHRVGAAIGAGLRFAVSSSPVRRVLTRALAFGIGAISFQALLPLVAREQLKGSEIGFGLMFGAFGVGSVITAVWVARVRRRFGPEAIVSAASIIAALAVTLLAVAPNIPIAMAAAFMAGCGHVSAMTSLNVSIQMRSPDELLGRSLSIFQSMIFGGMAVGSAAWGTLSDFVGTPNALLASAAWLLASLVVLRVLAPMPGIGEGHAPPAV
ncbi:MFS transporter [Erythrobacter sp. SG61-1L]|uniref:MFS transporter n=1 Tax=Erythrobacter sp. SG61-1L TaxID=1603897 RepID=UPI000A856315|nr:MFS transporter [Erythrobacter sp. SG61-1L]